MEKRKSRGDPATSMTVVKAAAWAWYQRGSGSEDGNPAREHDATRRRHGPPRPSRYKLEAMRQLALNKSHKRAQELNKNVEHKPLSLLDDYEVRSISRQLDSFIECANVKNYDVMVRQRDVMVSSSDDESVMSTSTTTTTATTRMKWNMKRMMRGFWLRHAATVCGARDGGVVETAVAVAAARGLPGGPRVMVATRGPWTYVTNNSQ